MRRRDFLQMLGIGGATLTAGPIVPLFSGKDSKIWTPEHTRLTSSHIVLTRPPNKPWKVTPAKSTLNWKAFGVGARKMTKFQWPSTGRLTLCHMDQNVNPQPIRVEYADGHDPHHAYYRAAMKMRESFSKFSRNRLLEVPEYRRRFSTLVTLVDTPIFVSTIPMKDKEQLLCEISYTPYVIDADDELDLNGWEVYSENGEYPIEVPTKIDMDRLLSLDYRIVRGETALSRFGGVLLVG